LQGRLALNPRSLPHLKKEINPRLVQVLQTAGKSAAKHSGRPESNGGEDGQDGPSRNLAGGPV
jgi:hypothetical protein